MKVWRRLQAIGAVAVKNAVYALPANEGTQEDFEWLLKEIGEGGGEALLCGAQLVNGLSNQEVQALFNAARQCGLRGTGERRSRADENDTTGASAVYSVGR